MIYYQLFIVIISCYKVFICCYCTYLYLFSFVICIMEKPMSKCRIVQSSYFYPKSFYKVRAGQGKIFWLNRCSGGCDCSSALMQSSIVRCPVSYIDWPTIVLKVRTGTAILWIKGASDCKCRTPNDAIWILFIRSIISKLQYSYFYRTERGAFVGRLQFAQ